MALTNAYCTVAQLRTHFGDAGSALTTELLERAINATSRGIDKFCGRRFWIDPSVQTLTFDAEFNDLVWLDGMNEIATTTGLIVKTDSTGNGTYATALTLGTDFRLAPKDAASKGPAYSWTRLEILKKTASYYFPVGEDAVQVTAKFGWSLVPDDVEQACVIRAAAVFKRKEAIEGIASFADLGIVRIGRRDPDVMELLQPFLKMTVGSI